MQYEKQFEAIENGKIRDSIALNIVVGDVIIHKYTNIHHQEVTRYDCVKEQWSFDNRRNFKTVWWETVIGQETAPVFHDTTTIISYPNGSSVKVLELL